MSPASPDGLTTDADPGPPAPGAIEVDLDVACPDAVDGARWAALLSAALVQEGVAAGASVGLTFVGSEAMAELNGTHMGAPGPTDVLAFPIDGLGAAGGAAEGPPGVVGDIVLCPAVAEVNGPGHAGTAEDELALLVVHGALHLLGHDHAEPGERERMQEREQHLLEQLHGALAGDPWAGS